eukprot:TRINITY_DN8897_c0_g1_i1.p1 TRINITY_DN8897_c0_g1~~TRINITY_DN8897_c0_g1_i1.p1  ORF type:complete len:498 (+),score=76.64 TRINITY_DN8897_c0_g1_i1:81-1574(+)
MPQRREVASQDPGGDRSLRRSMGSAPVAWADLQRGTAADLQRGTTADLPRKRRRAGSTFARSRAEESELLCNTQWDILALPSPVNPRMSRSLSCPAFPAGMSGPDTTDADTDDPTRAASPGAAGKAPVRSAMWVRTLVYATLLICCGCTCVALVELMSSRDKGCGCLISAGEYLFGATVHGHTLYMGSGSARTRGRVPSWITAASVLCAVGYSQMTNLALASSLPMPVFLVLKSCALAVQLLVGLVVLGRRYSPQQLCAVAVVTLGAAVATFANAGEAEAAPQPQPAASPGASPVAVPAPPALSSAYVGAGCLVVALLLRSLGTAAEEQAFVRYRASAAEVLFYRALLGFFFFASYWEQLRARADRWNMDTSLGTIYGYPAMWMFLAGNVALDHCCKVVTARLCKSAGALSTTLVLTLQRLLSLVISAALLNDRPVSEGLWLGAALALVGSVTYASAASRRVHSDAQQPRPPEPTADQDAGGDGSPARSRGSSAARR